MFIIGKNARIASIVAATLVVSGWLALPRMIAHAQTAQPAARVTAKQFAGTWNWMFQDKRFATMTLDQRGDQLTGSITNEHIHMDGDGKITNAVASNGTSPISRAVLDHGVLHIFEKDGNDEMEWVMTLTADTTAELRISGPDAPANAEPIRLERVWSEPPVRD